MLQNKICRNKMCIKMAKMSYLNYTNCVMSFNSCQLSGADTLAAIRFCCKNWACRYAFHYVHSTFMLHNQGGCYSSLIRQALDLSPKTRGALMPSSFTWYSIILKIGQAMVKLDNIMIGCVVDLQHWYVTCMINRKINRKYL